MKKKIVKAQSFQRNRHSILSYFLDTVHGAEQRIDPEEIATNPAVPPLTQDVDGSWCCTSFALAKWAERPSGQITMNVRAAIADMPAEAAEAAFTLINAPVQTSGERVMCRPHYRLSLYGLLVLGERAKGRKLNRMADAVWKYLRPDAGCAQDAETVPFPDSDVSDVSDDFDNDDFLDEPPAPPALYRSLDADCPVPPSPMDEEVGELDDLKDAPVVALGPDGKPCVTASLLADAIGAKFDDLQEEIEGISYGDPEFFKENFKPLDGGNDWYLSTPATLLLGLTSATSLQARIDLLNAATIRPLA